jgi:RNA polymerase sigma factor (sigma-70 family)
MCTERRKAPSKVTFSPRKGTFLQKAFDEEVDKDMSDTDEQGDLPALVIAAQAGDSDAYAVIVQRFQRMALAIGQGMLGDAHLAQDAAQDAFIDAWQSLHVLREPAAFAGWFRRIVFKHCDRQLRAGSREWPMDEARELPDEISMSDSVEAIYARERVRNAMQALSRRQQQLADLFYLQGYSQQDIVSALDLPLSSVKKGLFLRANDCARRCTTWLRQPRRKPTSL